MTKIIRSKKGCCGGNNSCCEPKQGNNKSIVVDFLYLDLNTCERCISTEVALEDALSDISQLLKAANISVKINKTEITSAELAIEHRFESSPTIRVNGKDIDMELVENNCEDCGDLCGDSVDCRVWVYEGKEYNVPPKALIIDLILSEVYGSGKKKTEKSYCLPDNLKKFFEGKVG